VRESTSPDGRCDCSHSGARDRRRQLLRAKVRRIAAKGRGIPKPTLAQVCPVPEDCIVSFVTEPPARFVKSRVAQVSSSLVKSRVAQVHVAPAKSARGTNQQSRLAQIAIDSKVGEFIFHIREVGLAQFTFHIREVAQFTFPAAAATANAQPHAQVNEQPWQHACSHACSHARGLRASCDGLRGPRRRPRLRSGVYMHIIYARGIPRIYGDLSLCIYICIICVHGLQWAERPTSATSTRPQRYIYGDLYIDMCKVYECIWSVDVECDA